MKTAIRSLFVWLLLLALPWQGVAAARMLPAVATAVTPVVTVATVGGHARTAMARMHSATPAAAYCALHAATSMSKKAGHDGGSCASCCIGVALAPTPVVPPALAPPDFIAIPFRAGHATSADPSLPDRPPRPLSA